MFGGEGSFVAWSNRIFFIVFILAGNEIHSHFIDIMSSNYLLSASLRALRYVCAAGGEYVPEFID